MNCTLHHVTSRYDVDPCRPQRFSENQWMTHWPTVHAIHASEDKLVLCDGPKEWAARTIRSPDSCVWCVSIGTWPSDHPSPVWRSVFFGPRVFHMCSMLNTQTHCQISGWILRYLEITEIYAGPSSSKKRPVWLGHSSLHAMLAEPLRVLERTDVDSIKCVNVCHVGTIALEFKLLILLGKSVCLYKNGIRGRVLWNLCKAE